MSSTAPSVTSHSATPVLPPAFFRTCPQRPGPPPGTRFGRNLEALTETELVRLTASDILSTTPGVQEFATTDVAVGSAAGPVENAKSFLRVGLGLTAFCPTLPIELLVQMFETMASMETMGPGAELGAWLETADRSTPRNRACRLSPQPQGSGPLAMGATDRAP